MSMHNPHESWIEQCEAAESIRQRYGLKAAFDYVVAEKLLNFAFAVVQHPTFARELLQFVAWVRRMFPPEQIRMHLDRIEHDRKNREAAITEDDDLFVESRATAAAQSRQFDTMKDLLTATQSGTS